MVGVPPRALYTLCNLDVSRSVRIDSCRLTAFWWGAGFVDPSPGNITWLCRLPGGEGNVWSHTSPIGALGLREMNLN